MDKYCPSCRKRKNTKLFGKNPHTKDGLVYECKDCNNKRQRGYRGDYQAKLYFKRHYGLDADKFPKQFEAVKSWLKEGKY